ncbi:hypothetical protein H5407_20675 [Mitsuaria sp. WAJ17]|uniref:hypothetical protein n=1 Tax=Mitsuaria sp. WAJ17 TaxID=2761452 RepID=UPI0016019677|nr:hypothetical protein [Mitsuaria sp. WAJ17]MBB2487658.1 hypothetical protein [Mitsuaria sp. WAJ17]
MPTLHAHAQRALPVHAHTTPPIPPELPPMPPPPHGPQRSPDPLPPDILEPEPIEMPAALGEPPPLPPPLALPAQARSRAPAPPRPCALLRHDLPTALRQAPGGA